MNFIKKTVILKQITQGFSVNGTNSFAVAYLEQNSTAKSVKISPVNLSDLTGGKFVLILVDSKRFLQFFDLADNSWDFIIDSSFDLSNSFDVVIAFENESVLPVLYGYSGNFCIDVKEIVSLYNEQKTNQNQYSSFLKEKNLFYEQKTQYQDETVATENYYQNADVDVDNLRIKDDIHGSCKFFASVKPSIDKIFYKFDNEINLNRLISGSKWVKIPYENDKFYVLGLIYDGERPLYICYGVRGKFDKQPDALKGYCSFIPVSCFGDSSDGYWIMYQDADSGDCLTLRPV